MDGIRGTTHPLQTPLILKCIFDKLGVSDLKNCRLVHKLWHSEATDCMRKTAQVEFIREDYDSDSDLEEPEEPSADDKEIPNFLALVQTQISTFETLPFANNFRLHHARIHFPNFWIFCGPHIKFLDLYGIKFESSSVFRQFIFQSCPNLEEFHLCHIGVTCKNVRGAATEQPFDWLEPKSPQNFNLKRVEFDEDIDLGDISFVELFSYFPSIEEVDVTDLQDAEKYASRIFQALSTCREHDDQCWKIKKLSFSFQYLKEPESDLRFLLDENLSLETLATCDMRSPEHRNVLKNILSANANTLKSLKLEEYGRVKGEIFDGSFETVLDKMEDFTLEGAHITSLSFFGNMPNLKKLTLSYCKFSLQTEFGEELLNDWVFSSCKELTIELEYSFGRSMTEEEDEDLLLLFRRIPKVEKLRLNRCNNKLFSGICEILRNLVCLELESSTLDDCAISGLDEEDVQRIYDEYRFGWKWWRPVTVPRPNLSSLKNLRWFRYEPKDAKKNALDLCAALCGVQQLPQLQHLKQEGSTLPIWERLCEQFPWRDP